MYFFFFKQKTAYEMRISDWSSDVCSSDLGGAAQARRDEAVDGSADPSLQALHRRLSRARRRGFCGDRKPQGRIWRLSGVGRHQQTLSLQNQADRKSVV